MKVKWYSQKFDMELEGTVIEERKYTLKIKVHGVEEKDCNVIIKKRRQVYND